MVEGERLALELVDALRAVRPIGREHLVLHLLHVLLEAVDRGLVVVHHLVDDRVHHGPGAGLEQLRVALEALAHVVQVAGLAVADRDHEVLSREHEDLPQLHDLVRVDVAGGLEHEQHHLAEHLELRPLVRVDGVLDRERVEVELA